MAGCRTASHRARGYPPAGLRTEPGHPVWFPSLPLFSPKPSQTLSDPLVLRCTVRWVFGVMCCCAGVSVSVLFMHEWLCALHGHCVGSLARARADQIVTSKVMSQKTASRTYPLIDLLGDILILQQYLLIILQENYVQNGLLYPQMNTKPYTYL